MRLLAFTLLLITISAKAQTSLKPLTEKIIVKTNLFNLFARRPAISLEKPFTKTFSIEGSYVTGRFINVPGANDYRYNGFLVRAKKYIDDINSGSVHGYVAVYAGNLKRDIFKEAWSVANGYIGVPSKFISANSIRSGVSAGYCYFIKKRFVLDNQVSMGYGRYLNSNKLNVSTESKGYLDLQIWFSVGYCF